MLAANATRVVTVEQVRRLAEDKAFAYTDARRDFGRNKSEAEQQKCSENRERRGRGQQHKVWAHERGSKESSIHARASEGCRGKEG